MSYQGYEQCLCDKGHLFEIDSRNRLIVCFECDSEVVWDNSVDETNGDSIGYIQMDQFMIQPEKTEICNLKCVHIVERAVYRIPTESETVAARASYDQQAEEGKS